MTLAAPRSFRQSRPPARTLSYTCLQLAVDVSHRTVDPRPKNTHPNTSFNGKVIAPSQEIVGITDRMLLTRHQTFICYTPIFVHHRSLVSVYMYIIGKKRRALLRTENRRFRFLYVNHWRRERAMKGNVRDS